MKTSERFTNAVTKLYNAFHKGELNAMDCKRCAVGNICDNSEMWTTTGNHKVDYDVVKRSGYSEEELWEIESIFMHGEYKNYGHWNASAVIQYKNNDLVFKALCAVVEYLCELEGIPNIMDYQLLFETDNDTPKYQLEEVLC